MTEVQEPSTRPYTLIQEIGNSFYVYVGVVRVGKFKSYAEAEARLEEIKKLIDHE